MHEKELIKLYGDLAEILEGKLSSFIVPISMALFSKLKRSENSLHEAIC